MFGAIENVVADCALQRGFEKMLGTPIPNLHVGRDGCGELHQLVIQQRDASLDRMRHAHSIDLRENVQRQVVLQIHVLKRREPVSRFRTCRMWPAVRGFRQRQRGPDIGGKKSPTLVRVK